MTPFIHDILAREGWEGLFQFAKKQSVLGVVWDEVQNCLEDFGGIPPDVLKQWITLVGKIEEKNRLVNEVAWRISGRFAQDRLASIILKGQGLAQYYPTPLHRQSGDIDIWLWTDDTISDIDKRRDGIVEYVHGVIPRPRACYHHISFKKIKNIDIEVHFTPSWMYSPRRNKYLQDYFNSYLDRLGLAIPEYGKFNTPSDEFNLVFVLVHIYRHVFDEGIGLRQLMDYDMVLRKASEGDRIAAFRHLQALGLRKFAGAVMYVLREAFGTEERLLLCQPDGKEGRWLMESIIRGGNFGLHDSTKKKRCNRTSSTMNFVVRVERSVLLLTHYPEEALWAVPWRIWHWTWRKKKGYF